MSLNLPSGMQINAPIRPGYESILTADALALVAKLHRAFDGRRHALLLARAARQQRLDAPCRSPNNNGLNRALSGDCDVLDCHSFR